MEKPIIMANVIIIHGAYGNHEENWFPWMKKELENLDCCVFVPKFPTPENQTLENWIKVFEKYEKYLDKNTVVIGHSLGCAFLLNVLERANQPIKSAYLVAGFVSAIGIPELDNITRSFWDRKFDWKKIKSNCRNFTVYHSDNDPYVPLEKGNELAEMLDSSLRIITNAGHFNKNSGYIKFDLLLEDVKSTLQNCKETI